MNETASLIVHALLFFFGWFLCACGTCKWLASGKGGYAGALDEERNGALLIIAGALMWMV